MLRCLCDKQDQQVTRYEVTQVCIKIHYNTYNYVAIKAKNSSICLIYLKKILRTKAGDIWSTKLAQFFYQVSTSTC